MKKAISIETMFQDRDFHDRFRLAREAGFDHVEFGDWTNLDLTRVKALCRQYRLGVAGLAGAGRHALADPDQREGFLEHLSQSMAVAKDLGCPNLFLQTNGLADSDGRENPPASDFTRIAAATRALLDAAPKAERAGLVLLVKPIRLERAPASSLHTTPSAGDVVRVVNSPAVRLLYDVTQMQSMEGDVVRTLRKYRQLVGYVRVGGCPERAECSEVDLRVFRRVLAGELGYDGFVGFEFAPGADASACLEAARNF